MTLETPSPPAGERGRVLTAGAVAAGEGGRGARAALRGGGGGALLLPLSLGAKPAAPSVSTQIQKLTLQTSQGFQGALPEERWAADGVE